jgi:hypothetical protein
MITVILLGTYAREWLAFANTPAQLWYQGIGRCCRSVFYCQKKLLTSVAVSSLFVQFFKGLVF